MSTPAAGSRPRAAFRLNISAVGYDELRLVQRSLMVIGIAFFLYLAVLAAINSRGRSSLANVNILSSTGEQAVISHREGDDVSKLRIQDFHRLEVKGGRPVWEIRARDANYFHLQAVTHVNDANVTVYRVKQKPVQLRADSARLAINGTALTGATLEGHVAVEIDGSMSAEAQLAEYEAATRLIKAPDLVNIHGEGYMVTGEGMEMQIDTENILLRRNVKSRFEEGARAPAESGLGTGKAADKRPAEPPSAAVRK